MQPSNLLHIIRFRLLSELYSLLFLVYPSYNVCLIKIGFRLLSELYSLLLMSVVVLTALNGFRFRLLSELYSLLLKKNVLKDIDKMKVSVSSRSYILSYSFLFCSYILSYFVSVSSRSYILSYLT